MTLHECERVLKGRGRDWRTLQEQAVRAGMICVVRLSSARIAHPEWGQHRVAVMRNGLTVFSLDRWCDLYRVTQHAPGRWLAVDLPLAEAIERLRSCILGCPITDGRDVTPPPPIKLGWSR